MKIERMHQTTRLFKAIDVDAPQPSMTDRTNATLPHRFIKRRAILTVDLKEPSHPTVMPKTLYKTNVLREGKLTLGFSRLIELFRHNNSSVIRFLCILNTFPHPRSISNQKLIKGMRRNHILNAIFVFEIAE